MKQLLVLAIIFLGAVELVSAQAASSTFNIRVFGGSDTATPTAPVLLTANAVTFDQVDLSWSSSTDNFVVGGYVLSRDGVPIATTSLLSFSDTGLTASTTYSYALQAFDLSQNYSTSSNTLIVTTPDPPAPPTAATSTPSEGTSVRAVLRNLLVQTGQATATIEVETALPGRIEIRWGRTDDYELGYIVSSVFKRNSIFTLTDLEPGTEYQYEIVGYTPSGQSTVLVENSLITDAVAITVAPPNVKSFVALGNGDDITLSWQLPDYEIGQIRIVRSHFRYPVHPNDGAVVYQGLGTDAFDRGILSQYSPVYYTAFLYDQAGNVSSGAIALVYAVDEDGVSNSTTGSDLKITEGPLVEINEERVTPGTTMPDLTDLFIRQGNKEYSFFEAPLEIYTAEDFIVYVPVGVVSDNLKSIIATFIDPTDNRIAYSYLLRINKDRSAYEARVTLPAVDGKSQVVVEVYDFEAYVVGTYQAPLALYSEIKQEKIPRSNLFFIAGGVFLGVLALAVGTMWFLILWRRRSEDNVTE